MNICEGPVWRVGWRVGRPVRREAEQIVQLTENAVARTEIGAGR